VPLHLQKNVERYTEPKSSLSLYLLDVNISQQHRPPPILFL
jgi:hypothetical protein